MQGDIGGIAVTQHTNSTSQLIWIIFKTCYALLWHRNESDGEMVASAENKRIEQHYRIDGAYTRKYTPIDSGEYERKPFHVRYHTVKPNSDGTYVVCELQAIRNTIKSQQKKKENRTTTTTYHHLFEPNVRVARFSFSFVNSTIIFDECTSHWNEKEDVVHNWFCVFVCVKRMIWCKMRKRIYERSWDAYMNVNRIYALASQSI